MEKTIVIVGSSFAGYTSALTLAKLVKGKHRIVVIDKKPEFLFLPSLVWHPFGYRNLDDISFNVLPIYNDLGITFMEATVYGFDLKDQLVYTQNEDVHYDYLILATGTSANFNNVKGLQPGKTAWSICSMAEAEKTRKAWKAFLKKPGPLVIGATQGAGYFFAAYEFLLNALYHLMKNNLLGTFPIHFITPEPYLAHFGIGGLYTGANNCESLFERYGLNWHTNAEIHEVKKGTVILETGKSISSSFTMLIPQFMGINAIRSTRKLADQHGLIRVNKQFRHKVYKNVYAAGGAVYIKPKEYTPVPCGVPRTHTVSEAMAKTVAYNVASHIENGARVSIANNRLYEYCKQDMDHLSLALFGEQTTPNRDLDFIAKGSQEKWANLTIENYIESSFDSDYLKI